MFGHRLGLALGVWDVDGMLAEMPPRVLERWRAFYILAPWDAANGRALAEAKYKPPLWLTKAGRFLTGADIRAKHKEAGW